MSRTFQTPSIFPELTVYQNLLIGTQAKAGVAFRLNPPSAKLRDVIEAKVDELLGFINLRAAKFRVVSELAHGSQRLVEIAIACEKCRNARS